MLDLKFVLNWDFYQSPFLIRTNSVTPLNALLIAIIPLITYEIYVSLQFETISRKEPVMSTDQSSAALCN